jgi:hypothetical protein
MPCVGFEPMILAPEWAKTVYALDRSATVTAYMETITNCNLKEVEKHTLYQRPQTSELCSAWIFINLLK